jgi:hypothetical protein
VQLCGRTHGKVCVPDFFKLFRNFDPPFPENKVRDGQNKYK